MIKIDYKQLKKGMEIARPIVHPYSFNILLKEGAIVDDYFLKRLTELEIREIFIKVSGQYKDEKIDEKNDAKKELSLINILPECPEKQAYLDAFVTYKNLVSSIINGNPIQFSEIQNAVSPIVESIIKDSQKIMQFSLIKSFDQYTSVHSLNVTIFSLLLGNVLKLSKNELLTLGYAALLHDIGKIHIPTEILNKPDKLSNEEFAIIKQHPLLGFEEAQKISRIDELVLRPILEHHEKTDGSGYPYGKTEVRIHLFSQIVTLCDVYDALTSKRTYREEVPSHDAIEYLLALSSEQKVNMELAKLFFMNINIYPKGTLVRLSNGKVAKVSSINAHFPLRPAVEVEENGNKKVINLFEEPTLFITNILSD